MNQNDVNFHYTPDFVVVNSNGRPLSRDFKISHAFKHVLELCDINPDDYCWHDLRHTYATLLKKNINNLKVISKLLGHSTVDMTEDVYFDDQRDIIDTSSIMTKYVDSLYDKIHMSDKSEELDMSKISDAFLKIR